MINVLLCHLDGKLPNLALMRLSAYHHERGDSVCITFGAQFESALYFRPEKVYGSCIFQKTSPLASRLRQAYPEAVIGGTGWDMGVTLESIGVFPGELDYGLYPQFRQSIGFTQRGCRLKCEFCVVPKKEGKVRPEKTIAEIWRGAPWPKEVLLLDNDFFGQVGWRDRIEEMRSGGFKVSFNQGINARCLTEEAAEAIASVDYRADDMKTKRIYTAWDSLGDEVRLLDGLKRLVHYGVKPDQIMVYMLIGYWPGETHEDRDYRRAMLRAFGARPYPMPYQRTPELVGFQRWVVGAYDKPSVQWSEGVPWSEWVRAKYQPANLKSGESLQSSFL